MLIFPRVLTPVVLLAALLLTGAAHSQETVAGCDPGNPDPHVMIEDRSHEKQWDVLLCNFQPGEQVAVEASLTDDSGERTVLDAVEAAADQLGSYFATFTYTGDDASIAGGYTFSVTATGSQGSTAEGTVEVMEDGSPPVGEPGGNQQMDDGIIATFDVGGEQFRVWVTNEAAIQQILDLQAGRSSANIPVAQVLRGPGAGDHNAPWSWHLDGENLAMAEVTIELCDGTPSYVEEHLDEWIEQVGEYCPWSAKLLSVAEVSGQDGQQTGKPGGSDNQQGGTGHTGEGHNDGTGQTDGDNQTDGEDEDGKTSQSPRMPDTGAGGTQTGGLAGSLLGATGALTFLRHRAMTK